jgi:hypothetical protein
MVATWICAVAAVIGAALAGIPFLTGKNTLADFFSIQNEEGDQADSTNR